MDLDKVKAELDRFREDGNCFADIIGGRRTSIIGQMAKLYKSLI